jgi:uncharacterized protein (TIGR02147 family)
MLEHSVFEYLDYRALLAARLPAKGEGRGQRSRLAKYLGCELSFVSLVLNKRAHFALEHAYGSSQFIEMAGDELEYFLLLFQKNRAGTKALEQHFDRKMNDLKKRRRDISARVDNQKSLALDQQVQYYSHWIYTAVHMCLLNPELTDAEKISRYLSVSQQQVKVALEFMLNCGLAVRDSKGYRSGPVKMHIPADSPLVNRHHVNWRLRALERLSNPAPDDIHYSAVLSASHETMETIRTFVLGLIEKAAPVIGAAADEAVYSFSIDLFEIGEKPH